MKRNIAYILGLFEDQEDPLFRYLKEYIESSGVACFGIEPFAEEVFGTQTFHKTVQRVQECIDILKPEMIVAHSLGAYAVLQISTDLPVILLDPSLALADIVLNNAKHYDGAYFYADGKRRVELSPEFVESIKRMPPIEKSPVNMTSQDIYIFGAGRGGYKIAERYQKHMPHAHYIFLPYANHEFSTEDDRQRILAVIKKRLDAMSNRREGVHTKPSRMCAN